MEITTFKVEFSLDKRLNGTASQLRGFFGTKFNEYVLMHHHKPEGFLYQYPFIQYKVIQGVPTVVGLNEGADVLVEIFNDYDKLFLGNTSYKITEKKVTYQKQEMGVSDSAVAYEFLTPWVALNQENYMRYYGLKNSLERSTFLGKTLVGNLISFSKAIGYTIPERLICGVLVKPEKVSIKGVHLMAFTGSFQVNFNFPEIFGLGKSVSRGFGAVKVLNEK